MLSRRTLYIFVIVAVGLLTVVGVLSFTARAQTPGPSISTTADNPPTIDKLVPPPPTPPDVILYSQYDFPSAEAYTSQNFETSNDAYDSWIADDFAVPSGQTWNVDQVDIAGNYDGFTGTADSFNVFIYTNAITTPGELVASRTGMFYTNVITDFSITVTPTITLTPGKYWVSVQANENYELDGQWYWTARTVTNSNPAAWQNPGDGFGTGCTTWGRRLTCIPGMNNPDQVFRLVGTITFPACGIPSSWSIVSHMPEAAWGPTVANDGKYAYVFGGYDLAVGADITQTLRYDPITSVWTPLSPVPGLVTMASSFYSPSNNKIYVFGGENANSGQVYSSTLIYDITSNSWASGAAMPDVRVFMAGGYSNGKVYLAGGYSTGSINPVFDQLWEYDIAANTWATKTSMPSALGGAGSAVVNGHLYVIGGRDGANNTLSQTYDYNIAGDSWTVRSDTLYPVNVPGSAVVNGKVWVVGGGTPFLGQDYPGLLASYTPNTLPTTQIYDPVSDTWVNGPSLNVERSFLAATLVKGRLLAIGGYGNGNSSDVVEEMGICRAYLVQMRNKPLAIENLP